VRRLNSCVVRKLDVDAIYSCLVVSAQALDF
jgi:hypothetical protein